MTPEGQVKAAVKKILDAYTPVWYFMPVQGGYGKQGIPDFICCVNGRFLAIECKSISGQVTELQWLTLQNINIAEGISLVANDASFVIGYLGMLGAVPK